MGKGPRGDVREAIGKYGDPGFAATTDMADTAGNIYYGSPTTSPTTGGGRAVPRDPRRRSPTSDMPPPGGPTTGGPTLPPTGGPGGNQDHQTIIRNLIGDRPLNVNTLRELEPQLSQYGMRLRWNARGTGADIVLPDGQEIDFIGGMEGPESNRQFQWMPTGENVPGGGGGGPQGQSPSGMPLGGVAGMSINDYLNIMSGYGDFAKTGGFTPEALGQLRQRATSPIRSVYSDTNRAVDRSRSLQGDYAPGYAATKAKLARDQAATTADATSNIEGQISEMVRQGKLSGLGGMAGMYGATPGLANMFGNQALQSRALANQMGLGLIGAEQGAAQLPGRWDTTMGRIGQVGGAILPWLSDRNAKKNIKPAKGILSKLKKLPISTWSYKDDPEKLIHVGPMAQDFSRLFGGDDKTIHPVDVAGVTLGAIKELAYGH